MTERSVIILIDRNALVNAGDLAGGEMESDAWCD